jgi:hypothetical protein
MKTNGSAVMLVHLKLFTKELETEIGAKFKRIQSNGGSEYKRLIDAYLKEDGFKHELTAPTLLTLTAWSNGQPYDYWQSLCHY